ncbi:MAG: HD-GYP domain-containing protein [Gemmatimonadetes bacterium]|nr:HD-GYP domain-containing protein [Gemmatimonadota bacterium]
MPTWVKFYIAAVFLGGLALLAYVSSDLGGLDWHPRSLGNVILWSVMIAVAAVSPIPLPRGGATVTVTSALDFAAILVFGPAVACWFGVVSDLLTNVAVKRNPPYKVAFNLGQIVLSIGGAGLVYTGLGGKVGAAFVLDQSQVLPLVMAPIVYFLLNTGLISLAIGGKEGISAFRIWQTNFQWEILHVFFFLPFGILLSLVHLRIGPVGVALFLIPLFLARFSFKLWIDTKEAHIATVQSLVSAIDASDPFTCGHSYRISKYAVRIARHLGVSEKEVEEIEYGALLHDIGKIAIQHDILLKPARLNKEERELMKTHPKVGRDILRNLRFLKGAAEIVYCHHEQPDGKGYPRGLTEERIPMGSRIIMVVDAFDAMTSDRPYRRGLTSEIAFEELRRHSGTQFFPDVVEALIELHTTEQLFDEIDVDELDMYTSAEYNSKELQRHVAAKLKEKHGEDDTEYLKRALGTIAGDSSDQIPVASTIDPNAAAESERTTQ